MFSGTEIESLIGKHQTREMQRDAYLKVGAFVALFTFGVALLTLNIYGLNLHFFLVMVGSAAMGILVGYLTHRRSFNIAARLLEQDRETRLVYKDKKIKEMQKQKAD
jgi:hypothetical protein